MLRTATAAVTRSATDSSFTSLGFSDWKKTFGHNEKENALLKHSTSSVHKSAMCAWREYHRSAARGQTIAHDVMVSAKRRLEEDIGENRYYVKTLIEILLLCAKQGI